MSVCESTRQPLITFYSQYNSLVTRVKLGSPILKVMMQLGLLTGRLFQHSVFSTGAGRALALTELSVYVNCILMGWSPHLL
jgi:hypothetical protein